MQLLDDIIAILSESKGSLTDALLKTKVLLYQLGMKEHVTWVSAELTGYTDFTNLPPYRIIGAMPHASLMSPRWTMADWRLPTGHLNEEQRKHLTQGYVDLSIQSLEETVKRYREKGKGGLQRPLDPALAALFREVLEPGVHIVSLWCDISMSAVEGILDQVRSRLLDFTLELREKIGNVGDNDLPTKANEIQADKIFTQTIYNQGGTVIVGNQNIQLNNQQGDIEALVAEVARLGYDVGELDSLRKAVVADGKRPTITEGETSKWYMSALKKVGEGAVNFTANVVTKLMVEALKHYSGDR